MGIAHTRKQRLPLILISLISFLRTQICAPNSYLGEALFSMPLSHFFFSLLPLSFQKRKNWSLDLSCFKTWIGLLQVDRVFFIKNIILCEVLYSLFLFPEVVLSMYFVFSSISSIMESVQEQSDCKVRIEFGVDGDPHWLLGASQL